MVKIEYVSQINTITITCKATRAPEFLQMLYHITRENNEEKADIKLTFDDEEVQIIHIEKTK